MIKQISILAMSLFLGLAVAGCTQTDQRLAGYGAGGAALGALAGGAIGGSGRGALAGAALGGVAGTFLGATENKKQVNSERYCNYRDRYGRIYSAPCNG